MENRLEQDVMGQDVISLRPRLVKTDRSKVERLGQDRLSVTHPVPSDSKWSFVTRNVVRGEVFAAEAVRNHVPQPGDLILAQTERIAQHTRIQLASGRRSKLFPGDNLVVAYGNRYAPDQFEAEVPQNLDRCHLVASGGIAAQAISKFGNLKWPTKIKPIAYLLDSEHRVLNLSRFGTTHQTGMADKSVIVVAGTSMNSGKTTAVSALVRGFSSAGYRVAAIKVTGTGSGNDIWSYQDAGAALTLDFTDAGYASTYKLGADKIEDCYRRLIATASVRGDVDILVAEIADGLLHHETMDLLRSPGLRDSCRHLLFAAGEALGAQAGVQLLRQHEIPVSGICGVLSASRLTQIEARAATGLPVYTQADLESADISRIMA